MNQHHHDHHSPQHGHKSWKPHRDWRVWGVILMLIAMAVYILSFDESLPNRGPEQPADVAPADAP